MSTTTRQDGSLWIEEYSLVDLILAVQAANQDGYVVSLTNENYPSGFSGHFTVGMTKAEQAKSEPAKSTVKNTSSKKATAAQS